MHPAVRVLVESARGCGYRSAGGIYLMSGGFSVPCGRLPIPLETCPTCSAGIKPARGISRRISQVPRDFNLLTTWVWLAHRRAIPHAQGPSTAGVFRAFKPERVEYVLKGDETDEQIDDLLSRGLSPVKVIRDVDHTPLFNEPSPN